MQKALSIFLVLAVGGALGWLTLRQVAFSVSRPPKGLAEVSLYQGQLVRLRQALVDYETENGALPSTDSREVMALLSGKNARQRVYLDASLWRFDPAGAPIDPWGRVYRFELRAGRTAVVEEKMH